MYQFHYLVMKPTFGNNNIEICMMDTDSFIYQIYSPDIKPELEKLHNFLDFSNYSRSHPLFSEDNKNNPGR